MTSFKNGDKVTLIAVICNKNINSKGKVYCATHTKQFFLREQDDLEPRGKALDYFRKKLDSLEICELEEPKGISSDEERAKYFWKKRRVDERGLEEDYALTVENLKGPYMENIKLCQILIESSLYEVYTDVFPYKNKEDFTSKLKKAIARVKKLPYNTPGLKSKEFIIAAQKEFDDQQGIFREYGSTEVTVECCDIIDDTE